MYFIVIITFPFPKSIYLSLTGAANVNVVLFIAYIFTRINFLVIVCYSIINSPTATWD